MILGLDLTSFSEAWNYNLDQSGLSTGINLKIFPNSFAIRNWGFGMHLEMPTLLGGANRTNKIKQYHMFSLSYVLTDITNNWFLPDLLMIPSLSIGQSSGTTNITSKNGNDLVSVIVGFRSEIRSFDLTFLAPDYNVYTKITSFYVEEGVSGFGMSLGYSWSF